MLTTTIHQLCQIIPPYISNHEVTIHMSVLPEIDPTFYQNFNYINYE